MADPLDGGELLQRVGHMTRDANGDLYLGNSYVQKITTAGVATTFLSESDIQSVIFGADDLEGLAFDSDGNFYAAEDDTDSILKFDTSLNGSVFVSAADIQAVTGVAPNLNGGIAFETLAVPEPSSIVLLASGAACLIGFGWRRKRRMTA